MEHRMPGIDGGGNGAGADGERRAAHTPETFGQGEIAVEKRQGEQGASYSLTKRHGHNTIDMTIDGEAALADLGFALDAARFFSNKDKLEQIERESQGARQSTGMKP